MRFKGESFRGKIWIKRLPSDLEMRILGGSFVRSKGRVKTRGKGFKKMLIKE
jgi:hypothetical protein